MSDNNYSKHTKKITDYNIFLQKMDEYQIRDTKMFDYYNKLSLIIPPYHKMDENPHYSLFEPNKNFNIFDMKKGETNINTPTIFSNPKKKVNIECDIDSIDDLLTLINTYKLCDDIEYNINMEALHNIEKPLFKLNNMIGMKDLKYNIVYQILYFIQDFHKLDSGNEVIANSGDFMHTVIYGPPGTGKTEIAMLMGEIYSKLGILNKKIFKKVTRSDLVAGYLGQTAIKTKEVIKECIGGVLFIDEAYSLGNTEQKDSFSKECIDTLCEAMSAHKHELMVIIAGYKNELNECFFRYNQGLDSRFPWRFKTDDYNYSELYKIFVKKVTDIKWSLHKSIEESCFKNKMVYFKYFGRDIETLLAKIKIAHSKRVFCNPNEEKRLIIISDLEKGLILYLNNEEVKNREKEELLKKSIANIYV